MSKNVAVYTYRVPYVVLHAKLGQRVGETVEETEGELTQELVDAIADRICESLGVEKEECMLLQAVPILEKINGIAIMDPPSYQAGERVA